MQAKTSKDKLLRLVTAAAEKLLLIKGKAILNKEVGSQPMRWHTFSCETADMVRRQGHGLRCLLSLER